MEHRDHEPTGQLTKELAEQLPWGDHAIWGHGTASAEVAEKILQEGIRASRNFTLLEIATPVGSGSEDPADKNAEALVDQSLHWPHKSAKQIVLLGIPNGYRETQVREDIQDESGEHVVIPPRFIAGYIDALNLKFVSNPEFEVNAAPTTEQTQQTERIRQRTGPVVIPTPLETDVPDSEIW